MKGDIRNNVKAWRRCLCKKDLSLHRSLNITNHSMSLLVTLYSEVFSQELLPLVFLAFTIWVTDGWKPVEAHEKQERNNNNKIKEREKWRLL